MMGKLVSMITILLSAIWVSALQNSLTGRTDFFYLIPILVFFGCNEAYHYLKAKKYYTELLRG